MTRKKNHSEPRTRINTEVSGELSLFIRELQRRGYARTVREIVTLALSTLKEKIIDQDLRAARLRVLTERGEETDEG